MGGGGGGGGEELSWRWVCGVKPPDVVGFPLFS